MHVTVFSLGDRRMGPEEELDRPQPYFLQESIELRVRSLS